jgi:SIR2-like domain
MSDDEALQNEVEEILGVWSIPAGLASFGKLAAQFGRRFGETVLTTNFDPLIGVAIRQAGGHYFRVCVTTDGDIRASGGSVSRVVHLHGYFHNSETLHTQSHLSMRRPHLEDSLKMLLLNKTIVVMGYGGWDDSLMRALSDIAAEPKCGTRIIWCFYERDERAIQRNCRHILGTLSAAYASGRLTLIKGFNVNQHLPELWSTLSSQELLLRKGLFAYVGNLAGLGDEFDFKPMSQVFNQVLGVDFAQAIEEHWCIDSEKIFSVFENLDRSPIRNDVRTVVAWWLKAVYGDSVQLDVDPEGADGLLSDARN